jgi:hypothetical protein
MKKEKLREFVKSEFDKSVLNLERKIREAAIPRAARERNPTNGIFSEISGILWLFGSALLDTSHFGLIPLTKILQAFSSAQWAEFTSISISGSTHISQTSKSKNRTDPSECTMKQKHTFEQKSSALSHSLCWENGHLRE